MSQKGRSKRLKNGLTLKENQFIKEIIKQIKTKGVINGTQAVLKVYDTKNSRIAQSMASENFSKPIIQEKIESVLKKSGISQEKIIGELNELATAKVKNVSGDVKLRTNIELLKLLGAYPERKRPDLTFNINTQINKLGFSEAKKKLQSLSGINEELVEEAEIEGSSP